MQTWSTITKEALDVECNLKMIYSLIRNILSNMQLHLLHLWNMHAESHENNYMIIYQINDGVGI